MRIVMARPHGRRATAPFASRLNCPHARYESIARSGNGFDVAMRTMRISERFPQGRDVHRDNGFFDERVRPDQGKQFVFGRQLSGAPHEDGQEIARLRLERNTNCAFRQPALRHVERELAELEDIPAVHQANPES
jgi:hypothetical protein